LTGPFVFVVYRGDLDRAGKPRERAPRLAEEEYSVFAFSARARGRPSGPPPPSSFSTVIGELLPIEFLAAMAASARAGGCFSADLDSGGVHFE
jgi:hypothetical protein